MLGYPTESDSAGLHHRLSQFVTVETGGTIGYFTKKAKLAKKLEVRIILTGTYLFPLQRHKVVINSQKGTRYSDHQAVASLTLIFTTVKNLIDSNPIFFLAFIFLATLVYSCETGQTSTDTEEEVFESPLPKEILEELKTPSAGTIYFAFATLAESVNDTALFNPGAHDTIQRLAKQRIYGATHNQMLVDSLGIGGELVWGPAVVTKIDTDGKQSSANLMYCVKQQKGNYTNYVVSIAGTNPISKYDWFVEDLAVDTMVNWGSGDSKISIGSQRGFNQLNAMTDPSTRQTLTAYLQGVVDRQSIVIVTGHSLGGALAQVMTSHLRQQLAQGIVSGITFAGPSAGNAAFMNALGASVNGAFIAHNNDFDAIPHAWQADQLNELCNIYDGQRLCFQNYQHNVLVNGVVNYLKEISAQGNYTNVSRVVPFSKFVSMPLDGVDCEDGSSALYFYLYSVCSAQLDTIKKHCGGGSSGISLTEAQNLAFYMVAMGLNHTTAYMEHFIANKGVRSTFAGFAPGAKAPLQNTLDAEYTLNTFLQRIADYYSNSSGSEGTCACN